MQLQLYCSNAHRHIQKRLAVSLNTLLVTHWLVSPPLLNHLKREVILFVFIWYGHFMTLNLCVTKRSKRSNNAELFADSHIRSSDILYEYITYASDILLTIPTLYV